MPAGRPTSLTPEVQNDIVASLRNGNYRSTAAQKAGVHRSTLVNWERRGEQGEEPYTAFLTEMLKAEAEFEGDMIDEVRTARAAVVGVSGPDLWQARMTLLERRFPNRWSARVRASVDEELGALMRRLEEKLDDETFAKVTNAAREDAGEADPRH